MRQDLLRVLACPGCGRPLSQESNELGCDRGHSFPIIDGVPCFLPSDMMPSGVETAGLRAFERRGRIHSWAVTHWENLGLREIIGPAPTGGASLLCLGGGDSEERRLVEQLGYVVTSLDIAPIDGIDMLADGHVLPLRDNQFDVVTSFEVFEHLTAPWLAVKEVARVVRPGGTVRRLGGILETLSRILLPHVAQGCYRVAGIGPPATRLHLWRSEPFHPCHGPNAASRASQNLEQDLWCAPQSRHVRTPQHLAHQESDGPRRTNGSLRRDSAAQPRRVREAEVWRGNHLLCDEAVRFTSSWTPYRSFAESEAAKGCHLSLLL